MRERLLEALRELKEDADRCTARMEKRFLREIAVPSSLADLLGGLTKEEMNKIRRSYGFKRLSALNKADLAARLVELVPDRFVKILHTLDQGRYSLLKKTVKNSGVLEINLEVEQAEALLGSCLLFPGVYNNKRILYIPRELGDIFTRSDDAGLKKIIKRNTEWIALTHGALYYYGTMGIVALTEKIEELTGNKVDYVNYIDVLTPSIEFYGRVRYSTDGLCDHRVINDRELLDEQRSRPSVDYYPFTKRELLRAGVPGFVDRTPAMNAFLMFLEEHYDLDEEEKNEISMQLGDIISRGGKPDETLKYLETWLELPSFEFVQLLTAQISELHNNTRQWALKGHTPSELFQEEKKFLRPLPAEPFPVRPAEPEVIDLKTRKKIGRNDPCPCGSGKKFKKCCGR